METIIKKAIEGGYKLVDSDGYTMSLEEIEITENKDIVLDPLFFQALGKSCEWGSVAVCNNCTTGNTESSVRLTGVCMKCGCPLSGLLLQEDSWVFYGLMFHRINFTEGWDKAIQYLSDLIK